MKRLSLVMMFITITALLASTAHAKPLTTDDFLLLPEDMQIAYASGIIEGISYVCHRQGETLEVNLPVFHELDRAQLNNVIVQTMFTMKRDLPITGKVRAVSTIRAIIFTSETILDCEARPGVPS
jgi:hypothetical protein